MMNTTTIGDRLFEFFSTLSFYGNLPDGYKVMNPYVLNEVLEINKIFYARFYNDDRPRTLIMGINPGRFGAGVTGISFTDPVKLTRELGIKNSFTPKPELSADFIYSVIKEFGGPEKFFSHYILSALSPLGFTLNGLNANFYDSKELLASTKDLIIDSVRKQVEISGNHDRCILLGSGKNLDFFGPLNEQYKFFQKIEILKHPRWIMQYRRKSMNDHIKEYIEVLCRCTV